MLGSEPWALHLSELIARSAEPDGEHCLDDACRVREDAIALLLAEPNEVPSRQCAGSGAGLAERPPLREWQAAETAH